MLNDYTNLRAVLELPVAPGPWGCVDDMYSDCAAVVDANGFQHVDTNNVGVLLGWSEKLKIHHWAESADAHRDISYEEQVANARYIAAASPAVIKELLEERDRMKATLETVAQVLNSDDPAICDTIWVPAGEGEFAPVITLYELVMDVLGGGE